MNSRERVIAALERKVPDRLPTFEWLIDSGVINAICPGADLFDFVEKMGIDAIAIRPDFKKEKVDENTYQEETGLLKKKMTEDYLIPVDVYLPAPYRGGSDGGCGQELMQGRDLHSGRSWST